MRRFHLPVERALMARRRRLARSLGMGPRQHHRKRHPQDCGVPQCGTCHGDKFPRRKMTRPEARSCLCLIEGRNEAAARGAITREKA